MPGNPTFTPTHVEIVLAWGRFTVHAVGPRLNRTGVHLNGKALRSQVGDRKPHATYEDALLWILDNHRRIPTRMDWNKRKFDESRVVQSFELSQFKDRGMVTELRQELRRLKA